MHEREHTRMIEIDCFGTHTCRTRAHIHTFLSYRQLFHALFDYRDKIMPSLETMSFIMSKRDYLEVCSGEWVCLT